jgi:hypothetical protein
VTGITAYLKNGGTLEKAAAMANHASTRTTQLYDRRRDELSLDEVERIGDLRMDWSSVPAAATAAAAYTLWPAGGVNNKAFVAWYARTNERPIFVGCKAHERHRFLDFARRSELRN